MILLALLLLQAWIEYSTLVFDVAILVIVVGAFRGQEDMLLASMHVVES